LHIGGGAADDVEHVAGRGLVFERFFEVARAVAQLDEQPRILHRDDRLSSEILQQCSLLVGERSSFLAVEVEGTEKRRVFA